MPCVCPKCCIRINGKTEKSIRCDKCHKWHHLKCTEVTKDQFDIFSVDESFEWICSSCSSDKCNTCEIIFRRGKSISCTTCTKKYHITCVGLNNQSLDKLDTNFWICFECKTNIFPFNNITSAQIKTLSFNSLAKNKHENKLRTTNFPPSAAKANEPFSPSCSVCQKNVNKTKKAIPCPTCQNFIHKKCCRLTQAEINDLKRSHNYWECVNCLKQKFPMVDMDEDEILLNSFNSNWTCECKHKTAKPAVSRQHKLVLNYKSQTDSFFQSPGDEFDELFNEFHGLEPDFNYYDNHEFHSVKDKLTNPFSIIHTNICSLQQNGENLSDLLVDLEFKFDLIAVTETWT